jgi:hypothetical protein
MFKRYRRVGSAGAPEQGKTIHNVGVNHSIKNGFSMISLFQLVFAVSIIGNEIANKNSRVWQLPQD